MKLLSKLTAVVMIRLADMEHEARTLLSELDILEVRLHRAFEAVSIDAAVAYLNIERKQMLDEENRGEANKSLAVFPALGVYGLFSLITGRKPDWGRAFSVAFEEEPFGDIRIMVSQDGVEVVNMSKMAREQNMAAAGIVAYLEAKGNKVLSWSGFEARAKNLRMAILKGEVTLLGKEDVRLQLKPHGLPRFVSSEIRPSG